MDGVNYCHIGGIVTQPVELRRTKSGTSVVNLTIATRHKGEVSHHRAVVWDRAAEFASTSLHRGDLVYVVGPLKYREYTSESGRSGVSAEITVMQLQILDGADRPAEGNTGPAKDYADDHLGDGYIDQLRDDK